MADGNNYAFIDAQNVYMGTRAAGWTVDVFPAAGCKLRDKYRVEKAFWFVGYLPDMQGFYILLQRAGFIVIFKEVARDRHGTPKGNVDVDLTLHAVDLKDAYAGGGADHERRRFRRSRALPAGSGTSSRSC